MPISVNVGLSRKSSVDYQSQGQSINITAELDQSLLAKPQELQQQIAGLYQQAQDALDRAGDTTPANHANGSNGSRVSTAVNGRKNGHNTGPAATAPPRANGKTTSEPSLTASQERAILSICRRQKLDPQTYCQDEFGCQLGELTVREASAIIDSLLNNRKAGAR